MLIRSEQMTAFQQSAEDNFVRRIAEHLLAEYPKTIVTLPNEKSVVDELPEETLHSLIRNGIERARVHGLSFESSIAAFCTVMFEIAPNFDAHQLSQLFMQDEDTEPNARVDELLEHLTDKNWETIRSTYDAGAWQLNSEEQQNGD